MTITLTALYRYPVKSLRGTPVDAGRVTARGLAGDRRWMLVDAQGDFITQRTYPRLVLLRAEPRPRGGLVLRTPAGESRNVAAPGQRRPGRGSERLRVRIWRSELEAIPAASEVNAWLSDWLGVACTLVYQSDDAIRAVDARWSRSGERVSLADGFPYLLTSEESLADLNERLIEPVGMERFRANLVVRGAPAFAEDDWRRITCGGATFRVAKPCSRCRVVAVDPETGKAGEEPLATLAKYRRHEAGVLFGVNLVPEQGIDSVLRVGENVVLSD